MIDEKSDPYIGIDGPMKSILMLLEYMHGLKGRFGRSKVAEIGINHGLIMD